MIQDIRYGLRSLIKTPGFAVVALIVLSLGIGANTAIFTIVNSVLLRPLPYPDSDHLAMLWETNPRFRVGVDTLPVTHGNFMDWREQNSVFEYVAALGTARLTLSGDGRPDRINAASVTANFFTLMHSEPILGRGFLEGEEIPSNSNVAVLSYAFWERRFAGDPAVIGTAINLDAENYTIVGVAPVGFSFPRANELPSFVGVSSQTDLWRPMRMTDEFVSRKRANHQLCVIARLKPAVTIEMAQTEMSALASRLEQSYPESNEGIGVKVVALEDQVVGKARVALLVLMGAVGLVLLIACTNFANLLFARSAVRQREVAIKSALGATRSRIVRQFLTESVLLSLTGAILGTFLSFWGVKAMLSLTKGKLPRANEVGIDAAVLAFTIVISLFTGLLSALGPALQTSKVNLVDFLKDGGRGLIGGGRYSRVRGFLVIFEVAVSMVLMIAAGLMIKSLATLINVDPGFKSENSITMNLALLGSRYPTSEKQIAFFREVNSRISGLPGVQTVGLISAVPLGGGVYAGGFSIEDWRPLSENEDLVADRRMISADYFDALGIRLLSGRAFSERDDQTSQGVAIVTESLARRFFSGEDPIGMRIKLGGRDSTRPWLSIVGVAADVKDSSLDSDARPCIYVPYPQFPTSNMTLVVRAGSDPKRLISAIRDEVWAIDKDQPITDVKPMDEYVSDSVSPRKSNALLLTIFAMVAVVLATVGIYGVIAYSVSQRVHEIGVRMALGAGRSNIIGLILRQGVTLVLSGVVIGLGAAMALTRVLTSLLFGVSATDGITYLTVSILLIGVAMLASYVPARRAAKIDPMVALRSE